VSSTCHQTFILLGFSALVRAPVILESQGMYDRSSNRVMTTDTGLLGTAV